MYLKVFSKGTSSGRRLADGGVSRLRRWGFDRNGGHSYARGSCARNLLPFQAIRRFHNPASAQVVGCSLLSRPTSTEKDYKRWFSSSSAEEWVMDVPPLGDSITKGEVVEWTKEVGDYVFEDEEMCTMETDKVTFPVRCSTPGEIVEIFVPVDTEVRVGQPLLKMKKAEPPAGGKPQAGGDRVEEPAAPAAVTKEAAPETPTPAAPSTQSQSVPPASPKAEPPKTPVAAPAPAVGALPGFRSMRAEKRTKLSPLRRRVAERLIDAQSTAAMLTSFNEIDMSNLLEMRKRHKDQFEKVHGVKLGFMSTFVAAAAATLQEMPIVNAVIDGNEIVFREYVDISIAVSSPRGLVVPVIRDCQTLSFRDIEAQIADYGARARNESLTLEEMAGGTFSITNGGVFGSLFSTPMINMPQSAILGMHAVKERPVTVNGEVVSRPMMYVALTYDHRLIDGRESVTFLKSVKEKVENPERLLLGF